MDLLQQQQQQDKFTSKTIFLFFVLSCLLDLIPIYRALFLGEAGRLAFLLFSALLLISYKLYQRNKLKLLAQSIFAATLFSCFIAMFFSNGMFNSLTSFWGVTFSLLCFATVNKHISIIFSMLTLTTFLLSRVALELGFLHKLSVNNTNITIETLHVLVMSFFIYQAATRFSQLIKLPIKALQDSLKREHELNIAKDTFISNMSHELRTPLNGIYGVLQVLSMKLEDTKLKDLVSAAKQSSEALNRIVSDILDIQKMSNGKLDISPDWIETTKLFEQIERLHQNTANLKGISFEIYINQNTPDELYCDELRINQILNNLIGNSLKFTHEGSVKLNIDYQGFSLCLTVEDTGIGMDDIAIEHLFDRFSQADSSITKKYAGTGLGMAICKELVTLMNGSIDVDSKPDQGTTFIVKLPLQGKNKISKKPFSMQTEQATQSLIRVLLVDDSEMNLMTGKEILELKYGTVETASNGKEALAKLANEHFDIVISDIKMPNMSGEELLTRIIATYPQLPCIALTGSATEANTHRFLKLGFKAVVSKPFNLKHLIQVIENVLVE